MNLSQYIEISELDKKSISSFNASLIAIIDGVDVNDISSWKVKKIGKRAKEIYSDYLKISKEKTHRLVKTLKTDAGELTYKSIGYFDLSEYMDLEQYIKRNDILGVIALCYRKLKKSKYDADVWETHGGYLNKRRKLFTFIDSEKILPAYHSIIRERNELIKKYKGAFEYDEFNYEEEKKKASNEEEKRIIEEEKKKDEINKSFNFEFMMLSVADFDFTKLEEVSNMNINVLLRFILAKKTLEKLNKNG